MKTLFRQSTQARLRSKTMYTMRLTAILNVSLLLLCPLYASVAWAAEEKCFPPVSPWSGFGEIEFSVTVRAKGEHDESLIRFIKYHNGDMWGEARLRGDWMKVLKLSGGQRLFSGMTDAEIEAKENPLDLILNETFGMGILAPLSVLFPCGIRDVPLTARHFNKVSEKGGISGNVLRTSEEEVRYDLTFLILQEPSLGSRRYLGIWRAFSLPPLSDDYSIEGWRMKLKGREIRGMRTLGEVRAVKE